MKVKTNFRKMYLIDETMMNSKQSYQNMSLRPQSEVTSSIQINHPPVSADSTLRKVLSEANCFKVRTTKLGWMKMACYRVTTILLQ